MESAAGIFKYKINGGMISWMHDCTGISSNQPMTVLLSSFPLLYLLYFFQRSGPAGFGNKVDDGLTQVFNPVPETGCQVVG